MMKKMHKLLAAFVACLLFIIMAPTVMASDVTAEIDNTASATTSTVAGRYGYAAVTNLSDSGRGNVKGTFYYYSTSGGWTVVDSVIVSEDHYVETDSYGSTTGSVYYSFKGKIESMWHSFYGYSSRYGFIMVRGLYP